MTVDLSECMTDRFNDNMTDGLSDNMNYGFSENKTDSLCSVPKRGIRKSDKKVTQNIKFGANFKYYIL